jgi:DNA-directed RNA polymerase subunit N (RpoN/RPB10)
MYYLKCPSCGNIISNRIIKINEEYDKINNDFKLSNEEKEKKRTEVINSLKLKRYCCKSRLMTLPNLIDIINPMKDSYA